MGSKRVWGSEFRHISILLWLYFTKYLTAKKLVVKKIKHLHKSTFSVLTFRFDQNKFVQTILLIYCRLHCKNLVTMFTDCTITSLSNLIRNNTRTEKWLVKNSACAMDQQKYIKSIQVCERYEKKYIQKLQVLSLMITNDQAYIVTSTRNG